MGSGGVGEPKAGRRGGGSVGERGEVGVVAEEGVEADDGALIRAGFRARGWGLHPYRLETTVKKRFGTRKTEHTTQTHR